MIRFEPSTQPGRVRDAWHRVEGHDVQVQVDDGGRVTSVRFADDGFELVGLAAELWATDHVDALTPTLGPPRR